MAEQEANAGLDRVRHELRAAGVAQEVRNPLRSGIHTRGYLPHVKREGASYFVTFRLADSIPRAVLLGFKQRWAAQMQAIAASDADGRQQADRQLQRQIERYLDQGAGACHLRRPEIAALVASALSYFHGEQYLLDEWVIMPNHVHLILWPMPKHTLTEILRSRKRHTARQANLILRRTGQLFWQPESYDHWIRDEDEKARIRRYIRNNPVRAGLCRTPEEWQYGSAWAG